MLLPIESVNKVACGRGCGGSCSGACRERAASNPDTDDQLTLPVETSKVAEVRSGQKFVIIDTSVPGGKWVDEVIYDGTREADREAAKLMGQGRRVQVIDAVYYAPSEARLRALGMRAASEQEAEKLEAEAEANEAQADADRQKADAARMKEGWAEGAQGRKDWQAWFDQQSQEFQDKWNEMNEQYGDVVKEQYKTAAGGMYGYTKGTQRDVESTVRKATNYATKLAKSVYAKDERSVDFLKTHAKRGSKTAKLLLAAMSNVGPRVASEKSAGSNPFPDLKRHFPGQAVQAAFPGPFDPSTPDALGDRDNVVSYARMFGDIAGWSRYADIAIIAGEDGNSLDMVHRKDGKWYWGASVDLEPWRTASSSSVFELPIENKTAAKRKSPTNGMYGFPSKVARLSLTACSDLKSYIGEVAYDLHSRRTARHSRITGFLKEHSKTAKCGYSRMLLSCYPDAPKVAKQKLPKELEEHQFTGKDGDNPPPADADGDGKTNEPKPEGLKDKKASTKVAAGHHYTSPDGTVLADSAFLNSLGGVRGVALQHMGFGEFFADTPKGRVDFIRGGADFPGKSGRSHKVRGPGAEWLVSEMASSGKSEEMSSHKSAAEDTLKKAFVPDTVDGWLEWESDKTA